MTDAERLAAIIADEASRGTPGSSRAFLLRLLQERDEDIAKLKAGNHWPLAELPDCMMPDGADPCDGFKSLQAELVETGRQLQEAEEELIRLRERNAAVNTLAGADAMETWRALCEKDKRISPEEYSDMIA